MELLHSDMTVLLILAGITLGAIWLDENVTLFKKIGAAAITILAGMALSNLGVLPADSEVYDFFSHEGDFFLGVSCSSSD